MNTMTTTPVIIDNGAELNADNDASIAYNQRITVNDDYKHGSREYIRWLDDMIESFDMMNTENINLTIINDTVQTNNITDVINAISDYKFNHLTYITDGAELMNADKKRGYGIIIGSLILAGLDEIIMKADGNVNPDRLARVVGLINSNARNVHTVIIGNVASLEELEKFILDYDWVMADRMIATNTDSAELSSWDVESILRFSELEVVNASACIMEHGREMALAMI